MSTILKMVTVAALTNLISVVGTMILKKGNDDDDDYDGDDDDGDDDDDGCDDSHISGSQQWPMTTVHQSG